MQTKIRQIGKSQGVIIPSIILNNFLNNDKTVDVNLINNKIIISPQDNPLRLGWFDNYQVDKDINAFEGIKILSTEDNDWQW